MFSAKGFVAAFTLGLGLTAASPAPLVRRTDIDICPQIGNNNVPVPDENTFQLPLNGMLSGRCWTLCIGDQATCSVQSTICFDFNLYTLTFTYQAIQGYTYTEADIWLGLSAPNGPVIPQYTTNNGFCKISADSSTVNCAIPYQSIVGGNSNLEWLAGMCPHSDSQGLTFFLYTNAMLNGPNGAVAGQGQHSSDVAYWELTYRCSKCQLGESTTTTSPTTTPPTTTFPTTTPTTSSTTTSATTSPTPPCGPHVCFSTHFNSQSVPAGDVLWLSAVFKPKFSASSASVSFTNSQVTINGVVVSPSPPNSFIQLQSGLQTCGTSQLMGGNWQTTAPLPGSGNTFLSAVGITVPPGVNWAGASVTWCGDVSAPGEIDVQIAAAVYTSCPMASANPESCETHTNYHAGVPTGCLNNLIAGGTGGGGSNFSGSLSATFPVCR